MQNFTASVNSTNTGLNGKGFFWETVVVANFANCCCCRWFSLYIVAVTDFFQTFANRHFGQFFLQFLNFFCCEHLFYCWGWFFLQIDVLDNVFANPNIFFFFTNYRREYFLYILQLVVLEQVFANCPAYFCSRQLSFANLTDCCASFGWFEWSGWSEWPVGIICIQKVHGLHGLNEQIIPTSW